MKRIIETVLVSGLISVCLLLTGCGGGDSASNQATVAKTTAAPKAVYAASNINKITLSWDAVPGAESYNVYWSTQPGVTTVTGTKVTTSTNHFEHIGLFISQTYFYVVTAVSSAGESSASEQAATVVATDGANLYATHCLGCHGPVTATTIIGGTDVNIKAAIASNKGGMGVLSHLTDIQLFVISQQLPCH